MIFLAKNDIYVIINYDGIKKSTSIKYNTELPVWNEEFIFPINYSIRDFTIEIKDKNSTLSDKILLIQIVDANYGDVSNYPLKINY